MSKEPNIISKNDLDIPDSVTVAKGRTIDQVSRELLRKASGFKPSEQAVVALSDVLAEENKILKKNRVKAGTELEINEAVFDKMLSLAKKIAGVKGNQQQK